MKLPNEDIRRRILGAAKVAFRRNGFLKASMRDIARDAGISAGNIYNYFSGKDELLRAVVQPVIYRFHLMLEEHHGLEGASIYDMLHEDYHKKVTEEYLELIRKHRTLLNILFFKSQGSSLARFKEEFTNRATGQVKRWLDKEKARHENMNIDITEFFLHLHTVWMFSLFEEVIMHNVRGEDLEGAVGEYIRFEIYGWKHLFNL